jgi:hypothetical protein
MKQNCFSRVGIHRRGGFSWSRSSSISKEFLEPLRRQRGKARRILNSAMTKIGLYRARGVAIVGELVAEAWRSYGHVP